MTTRVVNVRHARYTRYVGRQGGNKHFGNPFTHLQVKKTMALEQVESRDEAVQAYEDWVEGTKWQKIEPERRQWILDNLHTLKGETLGCYCKPFTCHGDILARMADALPAREP